ncbi:unnamed protein product [Linum trigynum]|uniref:Uncharacterized protein n=1 Tax=Linum trigynum TaxID=586398 RepID=A0AAV2D139_9ROSI
MRGAARTKGREADCEAPREGSRREGKAPWKATRGKGEGEEAPWRATRGKGEGEEAPRRAARNKGKGEEERGAAE